jgi:hypothetical protein
MLELSRVVEIVTYCDFGWSTGGPNLYVSPLRQWSPTAPSLIHDVFLHGLSVCKIGYVDCVQNITFKRRNSYLPSIGIKCIWQVETAKRQDDRLCSSQRGGLLRDEKSGPPSSGTTGGPSTCTGPWPVSLSDITSCVPCSSFLSTLDHRSTCDFSETSPKLGDLGQGGTDESPTDHDVLPRRETKNVSKKSLRRMGCPKDRHG